MVSTQQLERADSTQGSGPTNLTTVDRMDLYQPLRLDHNDDIPADFGSLELCEDELPSGPGDRGGSGGSDDGRNTGDAGNEILPGSRETEPPPPFTEQAKDMEPGEMVTIRTENGETQHFMYLGEDKGFIRTNKDGHPATANGETHIVDLVTGDVIEITEVGAQQASAQELAAMDPRLDHGRTFGEQVEGWEAGNHMMSVWNEETGQFDYYKYMGEEQGFMRTDSYGNPALSNGESFIYIPETGETIPVTAEYAQYVSVPEMTQEYEHLRRSVRWRQPHDRPNGTNGNSMMQAPQDNEIMSAWNFE